MATLVITAMPQLSQASKVAEEKLTQELLSILIENAGEVEYKDNITSNVLPKGEFKKILLEAIPGSINVVEGEEVIVKSIENTECEVIPVPVGSPARKKCHLLFTSGTFIKTKDGLEGPKDESSISVSFELSQPVTPQPAKISIFNVVVDRAG